MNVTISKLSFRISQRLKTVRHGNSFLRIESLVSPDTLLSEDHDVVKRAEDFLIRGFHDGLNMIRDISDHTDDDVKTRNVEAYAKQCLYDLVRILLLANKDAIGKSSVGDMHIRYAVARRAKLVSPPQSQMRFNVDGVEYFVFNDGSVVMTSSRENGKSAINAVPISFEVCPWKMFLR
jgi:hypothetical protein